MSHNAQKMKNKIKVKRESVVMNEMNNFFINLGEFFRVLALIIIGFLIGASPRIIEGEGKTTFLLRLVEAFLLLLLSFILTSKSGDKK